VPKGRYELAVSRSTDDPVLAAVIAVDQRSLPPRRSSIRRTKRKFEMASEGKKYRSFDIGLTGSTGTKLPKMAFSRRAALAVAGAHGLLAVTIGSANAASAAADKSSLDAAIENQRGAMLAGDGDALKASLHDHLKYMHSSGLVQTKSDILAALAGKNFFASFDYAQRAAEIVDGVGVAMLTIDQTKNLPDGKTRASRIKVQQVWVNAAAGWKLLTRSSAIIAPETSASTNPKPKLQ